MKIYYSISNKGKFHKFSNDVDCLPPDAEHVSVHENTLDNVKLGAMMLEKAMHKHVCIDFDTYFYETES